MGGRAQIFQFLASEDVDSNQVDFSVPMFARLGSGHVDDLARALLDAHKSILPQCRALHGVSGRGAGIGGLESVLMLRERVSISDRKTSTRFELE